MPELAVAYFEVHDEQTLPAFPSKLRDYSSYSVAEIEALVLQLLPALDSKQSPSYDDDAPYFAFEPSVEKELVLLVVRHWGLPFVGVAVAVVGPS